MSIHPLEKILRLLRHCIGMRAMHASNGWPSRLYTQVLEWVTLGKGIPRSINQEPELRLVPSCRFLNTSYEPEVWGWLKARTRPGNVIFDIGAQFGLYSMLVSRHVSPGGKIYAFEPSPETVAVIKRHLKMNNMEQAVEVLPVAVGATSDMVTFYTAGTHPSNTLAPTKVDPVPLKPMQIQSMTVDDFCDREGIRPDVIKIDTEGWELHVLRGSVKTLGRPGIVIVVEMHPYAWSSAGYTEEDFAHFASNAGLEIVPLTGQASPLTEYGEVWLKPLTAARVGPYSSDSDDS